jgi:hypothetical protein
LNHNIIFRLSAITTSTVAVAVAATVITGVFFSPSYAQPTTDLKCQTYNSGTNIDTVCTNSKNHVCKYGDNNDIICTSHSSNNNISCKNTGSSNVDCSGSNNVVCKKDLSNNVYCTSNGDSQNAPSDINLTQSNDSSSPSSSSNNETIIKQVN